MKRVGLYGWCFLVWATVGFGQAEKRPLTVDDLAAWERITDKKISDDGKWIAVRKAPWQGDPSVLLYDAAGKVEQSIPLGTRMDFSPSSDFLVVSVVPSKAETDSLKLRKTKKEEMPMDKLVLHRMKDRRQEVIDSVRTYKLAGTTDWIAYQRGTKKDSTLYVRSLDGSGVYEFPFVTAYGFAEKGEILYYLSQPAHDSLPGGLYTFSTGQQKSVPRKEGKGVYKQVTFDKTGDRLAFLFCEEKDSAAYAYELYLAEQGRVARKVADKHLVGMPEGRLGFGETTEYIYLGIAPVPREKDSTLLAENRPDVHVWTWNEGVQYTQQDHNRKTDLKRTYLAVLHLPDSMITGLASPDIPQIITNPGRDAATVLGVTSKPYDVDRMWRGREQVNLYTIEVKTGWKELIRYGLFGRPQLSPEGNYAVWYSPADSSWYTYCIDLKKEFRLTTPRDFNAWNEENDVPDFPAAHGIAGWTMHDEFLLIYDRYDIWKFDPQGRHAPVNLTGNGRTTRTRYRLEKLDPEERGLDPEGTYLVSSFDETTKGTGFYSMSLYKPGTPKQLLAGEFILKSPVKAKRAARIIFTSETYTQYP
ncbi:MAG: S9 family peptidase, partial [Tannerellaceae bacterium]|nr:S9 family peptidase [Tannerellaceae bacterium]